ncbi:MAG: hypothetical protein OQJ99_01405 [Rhodospirillales bacterium]|nr:hypothetical protein [Rhodospirillales bacterium]MCW8862246.1 hypothetical protein [Rhodospirillales bacterium]MCW8952958.1 hypothetical protein [Rhodospirillales bacterium]MCW8969956.1 hypothetical protein [Rhodospirillales bacterium]MCW9002785.1 hypothetical protein [Rhodospirillales bacterium]
MAFFRYYLPPGDTPSFKRHDVIEAHDIEHAAQAICRRHGLSRIPDGLLISPWPDEESDSLRASDHPLRAASA